MRHRRALFCLVVALLCVASATFASPTLAQEASNAGTYTCTGRITETPDAVTVLSVQGAKFGGDDAGKKPARLVGVAPDGEVLWVQHSGREQGVVWNYDVDPLENGHVFVTATVGDGTVFYEMDPTTGRRIWSEHVDAHDTHDADLLNEQEIVVANMRNYNETTGTNDDRIFVYNRTTNEVVWEWRFADHYNSTVGGNYTDDWTHVNDVDAVGDDQFLVSPRNLDQVILVNRTTGDVDLKLGSDENFSVLKQQHNPDYLESENGTPTFLVADSENARIVEYEKTDDGWRRTWRVGNESVLSWPRDADRLPDGNTLVTDSANHRVIEVTPEGDVVWEVYTPWLVYEAARIQTPESGGQTIADVNATGSYDLENATPRASDTLYDCDTYLWNFENDYWAANREASTTAEDQEQAQIGANANTEQEWVPENERSTSKKLFGVNSPVVVGVVAVLLLLGALGVVYRRSS